MSGDDSGSAASDPQLLHIDLVDTVVRHVIRIEAEEQHPGLDPIVEGWRAEGHSPSMIEAQLRSLVIADLAATVVGQLEADDLEEARVGLGLPDPRDNSVGLSLRKAIREAIATRAADVLAATD